MREDPTKVARQPANPDPEFEAMSAFISESSPEAAEEPAPRNAGAVKSLPGNPRAMADPRGSVLDLPPPALRHEVDDPLDDFPIAIRPTAAPIEPVPADEPSPAPAVPMSPRAARWPIAAALLVGLAVGFASGYGVARGSRLPGPADLVEPTPRPQTSAGAPAAGSAPRSAGREFTEDAVGERPVAGEEDRRAPGRQQARAGDAEAPRDANRPAASESTREAPDGSRDRFHDGTREAARGQQPVDPSTAVGRLLVRSTPDAAQVFVDGHDEGPTPATIRGLARGPHRVRVVRDGYEAIERTVTITAGQPALSISLDLEPSRPESRGPESRGAVSQPAAGSTEGALDVESLPPGAQVYLDGRLLGTTPFVSTNVGAGMHALRLEHRGYRGWQSSVLIVRGERNHVTASLEEP
jgi:hypothetical protein